MSDNVSLFPTAGANALSGGAKLDITEKLLLKGEADDIGNAEAMRALYGRDYLFSPAYGWLEWVKTHWRAVPAQTVTIKAMDALRKRRVAAVKAGQESTIKATKGTRDHVASCLALFQAMVTVPDVSVFDADPDALNCQNGVLNLKTGELTPHDQSQRFTYCLSVDYDATADMTVWTEFLTGSLNGGADMVGYLRECAGYSFTGHTREEKLFYVFGPPRAGKGTYTETLLELLPRPLSVEVDFNTFTARRENDSQNFDLAGLKPARLVIASESTRTQSLNAAKIKHLTGGNDVHCAFKHKDMFTYRPQFKVWLVSNWEEAVS